MLKVKNMNGRERVQMTRLMVMIVVERRGGKGENSGLETGHLDGR